MDLQMHHRRFDWLNFLLTDKRNVLRIAICGCFNSGKTSLINLLFGLNLPVKTVTATGTLTKIYFGTKLFYADFADGTRRRITEKELNDLILVKKKTADGISRNEAVTAAWVGCPNELLQGGEVEFWDTPGLEDAENLDTLTSKAVSQCDVVIFVMDSRRLLSMSDKNFLTVRLKQMVGSNIIVVINKTDLLEPEETWEMIDETLEQLDGFGNKSCGWCPVFTSASKKDSRIKSLRARLMKICGDRSKRSDCLAIARAAKIKTFAEEWLKILQRDLQEVEAEFNKDSAKLKSEQTAIIVELEKNYKSDLTQIRHLMNLSACKFDDISIWRQALEAVKTEKAWEKNYVDLSKKIMSEQMKSIFAEIHMTAENNLSKKNYPSCFPLRDVDTTAIWASMDWGKNFDVNNTGGMIGGVAAGAAIGSFIPVIGTAIGAGIGFFAGMARDVSADNSALKDFQATCFGNTIQSYQQNPASVAKNLAENFRDALFESMRKDFDDRKNGELERFGKRQASLKDEFAKRRKFLTDYADKAQRQLTRATI